MYDEARNYLADNYPAHIAYMAGFEVQDTKLYPKILFNSELRRVLTPTKYWQWARKVCTVKEAKDFCEFMENLFSCLASSAGLERIFSSCGLVHTKLRNRLLNERLIKIVNVYCTLRGEIFDDWSYSYYFEILLWNFNLRNAVSPFYLCILKFRFLHCRQFSDTFESLSICFLKLA